MLHFGGSKDSTAAFEFLPLTSDIDGVWVRTTVAITRFRAEFEWFMPTSVKHEVATYHHDIAQGICNRQFFIRDSDCAFKMTFVRDVTTDQFLVALEARYVWIAQSTAINLSFAHATSPTPDVQSFLHRLSHFE